MSHDNHFDRTCPTCGQSCQCPHRTAVQLDTAEWFRIIGFCSDEVARQHDSPSAVTHLVNAWVWAVEMSGASTGDGVILEPDDIETLGRLVKPDRNRTGYRTVKLYTTLDQVVGVDPSAIRGLVVKIVEAEREGRLNPDEAYREFELVHPFVDGNGRVGKILFNWWRGTLLNPVMPSNWFGVPNP